MKIEKFEDIRAWQQARELANLVYDLTEKGGFAKDYRLRDQIQGAAGSIMHNIAEGFDDGSDAEFIHFLKYSRRSASEVQSEIYLALAANTSPSRIFNECMTWLSPQRNPSTPSSHICENRNPALPSDHATM
jgi:four helix bundle protein